MTVATLLTGLCVWTGTSSATGVAPVRQCRIAIDGRLDDAGWKHALVWTTGDKRISEDRFTCRVAYDEEFIYFAADVDDSDVRGTHGAPRSEVFKDDAIEFFFEVGRARARDPLPFVSAEILKRARSPRQCRYA